MDPLLRLQQKVQAFRKLRDDLEKELKRDQTTLEKLNQQIADKRNAANAKARESIENKDKLQRVELLINESEKSLKKIIETSLALEKAIDQEAAKP